jgi:hypothetical protein
MKLALLQVEEARALAEAAVAETQHHREMESRTAEKANSLQAR